MFPRVTSVFTQVWDLGGEKSLRPMWAEYYNGNQRVAVLQLLQGHVLVYPHSNSFAGADIVVVVVDASAEVCWCDFCHCARRMSVTLNFCVFITF